MRRPHLCRGLGTSVLLHGLLAAGLAGVPACCRIFRPAAPAGPAVVMIEFGMEAEAPSVPVAASEPAIGAAAVVPLLPAPDRPSVPMEAAPPAPPAPAAARDVPAPPSMPADGGAATDLRPGFDLGPEPEVGSGPSGADRPAATVAAGSVAVAAGGAPVGFAGTTAGVKPRYPMSARLRGEQGGVLLRVDVDGAGHASRVEVLRSSGFPALDDAARDAARRARYTDGAGSVSAGGVLTFAVRFQLVD